MSHTIYNGTDGMRMALARLQKEVEILSAEVALRDLEAAGEKPIALKPAAFKYSIPERTLRRYAAKGAGLKIGKDWFVFESRIRNFKLS